MQMNGFKDKKDGALVELSLLGNEKAYEELVIRYEKSVKGTALKVTENEFLPKMLLRMLLCQRG